jgi:hypothetical protein
MISELKMMADRRDTEPDLEYDLWWEPVYITIIKNSFVNAKGNLRYI